MQTNIQITLLYVAFSKEFQSINKGKMKQLLLALNLPKVTVIAIMMLYSNPKSKFRSADGHRDFFLIVAGALQADTLAPYLFIICLNYVLKTSIDLLKEHGFRLKKARSRRYPAQTITDADDADVIELMMMIKSINFLCKDSFFF